MLKTITLILLSSFTINVSAKETLIRTNATGFYTVSQEQLHEKQLLKSKVSMAKIHINGASGETPFFLKSKKKTFKKNDQIIFFSKMLHGETTFQHPLDDYNGYKISMGEKTKAYKSWIPKNKTNKTNKNLPVCDSISTIDHLESNELLIRVNTRQYKQTPELWYWKKLSQVNKKGFSVPLDFSKVKNQASASIKVAFRGINKDRNIKNIADHEVSIIFNGTKIDSLQWQGKTQIISDSITLPLNLVKPENNEITFIVPKRKDNNKRILDVMMLDYIKFQFEIKPQEITDGYGLFSDKDCKVELQEQQFAYSVNNNQYSYNSIALTSKDTVYIGSYEQLQTATLNPIKPLEVDFQTVEYVMIAHPLFIDAVKPLAEYYRDKGLQVAVVDINNIYQKYSYGVRELRSIKDFIKQAYDDGNGNLKYVLMVGDSSWDWRENKKYLDKYASWANRNAPSNRNFVNQPHFSYDLEIQNRDFVPTGQYHSSDGHSASDNWFVSVVPEESIRGEDYIPDVAIGRFTAATVAEAEAMVEKSINYQKNSKVGPWRSRVLWITNSDKRYQSFSKNIANKIGLQGAVAENIFPQEMDGDNLKVQETLTDSINEGDLIVHFVGHGGNSIWRIGPPDIKKNRDLFALEHIDNLTNKDALPFVMSMSCYSAPYDHPFADSIGEKFFREKDKGAIAVLAASWRNTPNKSFSKAVMDNIYKMPRQSLGEAIMNAKRRYKGRVAVEMYNLLGDPALYLALPSLMMKSEVIYAEKLAKISIGTEKFNGKVNVEFIDKANEVMDKQTFNIESTTFEIAFDKQNSKCNSVRIYAWDSVQNLDSMSSFSCIEPISKEMLEVLKAQSLKEKRSKQSKNNKRKSDRTMTRQ